VFIKVLTKILFSVLLGVKMIKILLFLWQLPQHLVGLVLIWFTGAKKNGYQKKSNGDVVWFWEYEPKNKFTQYLSGASLGQYIILPAERAVDWNTVMHEHGHSKQSELLGLLYLLVIGLPSVCNNLYDRYAHRTWSYEDSVKWYYNRYPEKWADELGGVKRTF